MSKQDKDDTSLDRRELLALAGTSSVGLLVGGSVLHAGDWTGSGPDDSERTADDSERTADDSERTADDSDRDSNASGETTHDIREFGAIEGEDTRQVAQHNREAIQAAAREADSDGIVYIPEGEYYFGDTDTSSQFRFGTEEPKGVSLEGAGPHESSLIFTSTVEPDSSYRGFRYDESDDDGNVINHGEVTIRNLCLDGNYEELDLDGDRTVWGINARGEGHFTVENVWIRGWWANGTKFTGVSADIRGCRYQENGIGQAQASDEQNAGHHIAARPAAGNTVTVEDSMFLRCSGIVINRSYGDGEVILRRSFVRGAGYACFKLSDTEGTTRVKNTYYNPRTRWMERNLPSEFNMDGRWFLYRVNGTEYTPTVILDNIITTGMSRSFVMCLSDRGINLKGDMIAVHDAAKRDNHDQAIRGDTGINFDIGTVSVHNTGGTVFDAPESKGSIDELRRDGNRGLGEIGDVSIVDDQGTSPLRPEVVRRRDVGITFPGSR